MVMYAISLLIAAHDHGKPKVGTNNFWVCLVGTAIQLLLMWWGGFFR